MRIRSKGMATAGLCLALLASSVAAASAQEDVVALPGEGVMFTSAEQVVSVVSAMADTFGCPAVSFGGAMPVTIVSHFAFPQAATTTLGEAAFTTTEVVNSEHYTTPYVFNGVRQHETALTVSGSVASSLFGTGLTALAGTYITDGPYGILEGDSEFTYSGNELAGHVIKDFYQGVPTPPRFVDPNTGNTVTCTLDGFLAGTCVVSDPGDYDPRDPFDPPLIFRDEGLEVTTKSFSLSLLTGGVEDVAHPKGKWRQTSFYRGPDGGNGRLTYTKVRIAAFGTANCALQLDGSVTGSISFPVFRGKVTVFPLGG